MFSILMHGDLDAYVICFSLNVVHVCVRRFNNLFMSMQYLSIVSIFAPACPPLKEGISMETICKNSGIEKKESREQTPVFKIFFEILLRD